MTLIKCLHCGNQQSLGKSVWEADDIERSTCEACGKEWISGMRQKFKAEIINPEHKVVLRVYNGGKINER